MALNQDQNNVVNNGSASEDEADEDKPIKVERSIALHNLDLNDSSKKNPMNYQMDSPFDSPEASSDGQNFISYDNPNVLKLTRMKWLTDGSDGCPDASSPSISPSISSSSIDSVVENMDKIYTTDKCLKTILSLDREQNMFGLSDLITLEQPVKPAKEDKRPVFPQTAIVQVCTATRKCRKSHTDFPASLKCGSCYAPNCLSCSEPYSNCCGFSSCVARCPTCVKVCYPSSCRNCKPKGKRVVKRRHFSACRPRCNYTPPICPGNRCLYPLVCQPCCTSAHGMTITVHKKDDFKPDDTYELTPRASCIFSLPLAMRKCTHNPKCRPPSHSFPYYMPCYWPSRPSAPCSNPARCFHTPPCPPRKKRNSPDDPNSACPKYAKCSDTRKRRETDCNNVQGSMSNDCANPFCPGKIPQLRAAIEEKFKATNPNV